MRRTARLATLPLNAGKARRLRELQVAYAEAKDRFLSVLAPASMWHHLGSRQSFRDFAKREGLYPDQANVHLVDQAAFDAVETSARHIESLIAISDLRARIWRRFDGEMRHYAYSLITSYADIGALLRGEVPERAKISILPPEREEVCRFVHRHLRDAFARASDPRVHAVRSLALDETLYRSFVVEHPGSQATKSQATKGQATRRQYVSILGAEPHKRIVLPLAGISRVSGNIRVVMDEGEHRAFVHVSYPIEQMPEASGPEKAIDWGVTEVATDADGSRYGDGYGKLLVGVSEARKASGERRGKLWSLTKKEAGSKRARHIARHNLGTKKQARRRDAARAAIRSLTGAAVREIVYGKGNHTRARGTPPQLSDQRPSLVVHEDLSHLRGKAKSKKLSRLTSAWMRSELEGRMVVHAHRGCSPTKAANAAYTSQTCPDPSCGYVHRDNRSGDRFHCRNPYSDCGFQGGADQVAAMNLAGRARDREITLFTPHTRVKEILDARFRRRMESRGGDTGVSSETTRDGDRSRVVEAEATAHGRTPSRPRRGDPDVGGSHVVVDSQSPVHTVRTGKTQRLESEKKRSA